MKNLVLYTFRHPSGVNLRSMACKSGDGSLDNAMTQTLLEMIKELSAKEIEQFKGTISEVKKGEYQPAELRDNTPDWSGDSTQAWFHAPMARPGCVCIANEDTEAYNSDYGLPQQYLIELFEFVLEKWLDFKSRMGPISDLNEEAIELPIPRQFCE